jgi:Fe2+ transport system protein FeoA
LTTLVLPLHSVTPGTRARLVAIGGERSFKRRLMELGLLPGTEILVVRNVEVGGVMELEVRSCRVSVRRSEAEELLVTPIATAG